jgi:hypothetical protein
VERCQRQQQCGDDGRRQAEDAPREEERQDRGAHREDGGRKASEKWTLAQGHRSLGQQERQRQVRRRSEALDGLEPALLLRPRHLPDLVTPQAAHTEPEEDRRE